LAKRARQRHGFPFAPSTIRDADLGIFLHEILRSILLSADCSFEFFSILLQGFRMMSERQISALRLASNLNHLRPRDSIKTLQSTSKFVTVDGLACISSSRGAGRPVGSYSRQSGSGQDWTRLLGTGDASHKILAFDRPGHGLLTKAEARGGYYRRVQARLLHGEIAFKATPCQAPDYVCVRCFLGRHWRWSMRSNYRKSAALVLVAPAAKRKTQESGSYQRGAGRRRRLLTLYLALPSCAAD